MPRPFCPRRVRNQPPSAFFKPQGIPLADLEVVTTTVDEYEALRLADLEGLYQEAAAKRMGVSRQTFGRIIESARRKVAEALVKGKALEIKGGEIQMLNEHEFQCGDCQHRWTVPFGTGRPVACPQCQSRNLHCSSADRGWRRIGTGRLGAGSGRGRHRGRRWRGQGAGKNHPGGNQ